MNTASVTFEPRRVGGVPLLLAVPREGSGPLPLVLWFHGFGVDAEVHRPELQRLAEAGFVAAGVDAAGHGRRRLSDLDARIGAPREAARRTMLELAAETAGDVPAVVQALVDEGLANPRRVAVAGVSMGGYVVYRSLLVEPSIRAAAAILGSPEWPGDDSPHLHPEAFHRTALLSVTAGADENVPPAAARAFHQALAEGHPEPSRARYIEIPGAEHLMNGEQWEVAMDETIRWLMAHTLHE
ncbi:MAG TPA: alpha/beta fold hydrolase [Longimicrobiaceae bacterium]|nr:alpha/beta fold hydrolase [Longimicrobiaceae bacterium]